VSPAAISIGAIFREEDSMATFAERMLGAARLDVATYEEVENDETATPQALAVVVVGAVAAGIGAAGLMRPGLVIMTTIVALIGWVIWAAVIYLVGVKGLPEPTTKADIGQLLRALGFASSPGLLRVFGIIPILGWLVGFLITIWMIVTMVVAVRQALDYTSTGRAVVVVIIGALINLVISAMFGTALLVSRLGGM
jgi:hypothetical protein